MLKSFSNIDFTCLKDAILSLDYIVVVVVANVDPDYVTDNYHHVVQSYLVFVFFLNQIRDGDSMLSPMLTGLLCGHHQRYDFFYPLMTFSPQSNQVMVKFVTDEIGTAQGFNMTWTSGQ